VRQLAHLAHGMATQPARRREGAGVSLGAVGDVHGDAPAQPVDQSPATRDEQQLRVLADENGRATFGETADSTLPTCSRVLWHA
jgi:hypothetical protein